MLIKLLNYYTNKQNDMKASIHINGNEIWSSNRISKKDLEKKVNELELANGVKKMADKVKAGFKVFTSK